MPTAYFYFHGELGDFIQNKSPQGGCEVEFNTHETVKHIVETLGVPHTEVGVIVIDERSVSFGQKPHHGDQVHIYPTKDEVQVSPLVWLKPELPAEIRFVLDGHLGKLAIYLRLLGFDCLYQNDYEDSELAKISHRENRILLTRDRGLLKRTMITYGYLIREKSPRKQLVEVIDRFELAARAKPFSRCANCNGILRDVAKEDIIDRLAPKTKIYYHEFRICDGCDQIYWKGSHFDRMEGFIQEVLEAKLP